MSDSKSTELREALRELFFDAAGGISDMAEEEIAKALHLFDDELSRQRALWMKAGNARSTASPLARLRLSRGLTQQAVADSIGMLRTGYTMVELGKANLLANKVPILAELYGVSTDKLLKTMYGGGDE